MGGGHRFSEAGSSELGSIPATSTCDFCMDGAICHLGSVPWRWEGKRNVHVDMQLFQMTQLHYSARFLVDAKRLCTFHARRCRRLLSGYVASNNRQADAGHSQKGIPVTVKGPMVITPPSVMSYSSCNQLRR